jgi:hypothetical protein
MTLMLHAGANALAYDDLRAIQIPLGTDTALVFPAVKRFRAGESLMQVILSPQETADFLFFLMRVMSMENASTTMPSTAIISYFIDVDWMPAMGREQLTRLKSDIETVTLKAKPRKSGRPKNTKPKSSRSKKS